MTAFDTIARGKAAKGSGMTSARPKRLSVILVSDAEGEEKTWKDESAAIASLAAQDIGEPFDLTIVESADNKHCTLPDEITRAFPECKLIFVEEQKSAAMKDAGAALCETEWVVVIDADCIAAPNWLRLLMAAADQNPDYDVFSGRTNYGEDSSMLRVLNLLDRSHGDLGQDGPIRSIPNNGALYKTAMLKKFPYPDRPSPFCSSRDRMGAMLKSGHKFYFVHNAVLRHAMDKNFVAHFRRHLGYANAFAHQKHTLFTGVSALASSIKGDARRILQKHRRYWRWHDWPLGLFMFARVRAPEILGIWDYLRHKEGPQSSHFR